MAIEEREQVTEMTMFPEFPPYKPKSKVEWKPSKGQEAIRRYVQDFGPVADEAIILHFVGDLSPGFVLSALDALGRHGLIRDTGERGRWTTRGRTIVWRAA